VIASGSASRYSLELTLLPGDDVIGTLVAESGFRREFHGRLELLAAIEAALSEQPRPVDSSEPPVRSIS
jgi:hypothetical protein